MFFPEICHRRIREMQLFAEIAIHTAICNSLHSTFVPWLYRQIRLAVMICFLIIGGGIQP